MRRRFFLVPAGAIAAALVFGGAFWDAGRMQTAPHESYRLAKVGRGDIVAAVAATGTLSALVTVQVGSQISGQISEVLADFNSDVRQGQVIARIDPQSFALRVRQAQADLDAARTQLQNQAGNVRVLESQAARARILAQDAQRDFERKVALAERGFISGAERDKARFAHDAALEEVRTAAAQIGAAEAQVAYARAVVAQREAQLAQAEVELDRTYIRAPVNGTVISRNVDAGQTVAASLQAPVLFTIAQDLARMQLEVAMDEADVGRIRPGQAATFTVDAHPGQTFEGRVRQVRKAAQVAQNVVTYTVVVDAQNSTRLLLPGMTASVRVITDTRRDVLTVPNAALRFRPRAAGEARIDPDEAVAGQGAAESAQARRERLTAELRLSPAQRQRLQEIFDETRARAVAIASQQESSTAHRRRVIARLGTEANNRIAEMLGAEQLTRFRALLAEEASRGALLTVRHARVYVVGERGEPREVAVRIGLSDGSVTELLAGELAEATEVIVGVASAPARAGRRTSAPAVKL